jgi:hypothetical protein
VRRATIGLCLLLVSSVAPPANAAAPAACPASADVPGNAAPARVVTGRFETNREGAYVLVPFAVPSGATRVQLRLCYDQPDTPLNARIKHTLDLGVYEPTSDGFFDTQEFRGWGGSSRPEVVLTPEESTTVGFDPGPLPSGEWAAEIGVAAVAAQTEGDLDGGVEWRLEIYLTDDPEDADEPYVPAPYDDTPAKTGPGWYKGDFHVHARHSNPSDATMRETFDYAFGSRPSGAGLDFITLSDYVGRRAWNEIGRFQDDYPGKLIVRSAEVITYRGHTNNHGSATYVDYRTGPIYELRAGKLTRVRKPQPASRIFADVHRAGGWTQVNHPTIFPSAVPGFDNICRGCPWDYTDAQTDWSKVDAFEVQTGPSGLGQPEGSELGPNPFTPLAIDWFDRLRKAGHRITAVGSSDSHKAGKPPDFLSSPIGEATTVLYAEELSTRGIQDAIEAGHAYVKFFSSDGPDLRLTARSGSRTAMMGDRLETSAATFTATVLGARPNPLPRVLLVLRDGVPIQAVPITAAKQTVTFKATTAGDYRLQLMRGPAYEALTNPITLGR